MTRTETGIMFAAVATLSTIGCLLLVRNIADGGRRGQRPAATRAPVPKAVIPNRPMSPLERTVPLLKRAERPKSAPMTSLEHRTSDLECEGFSTGQGEGPGS